jgi:signal transduction histidine kinase
MDEDQTMAQNPAAADLVPAVDPTRVQLTRIVDQPDLPLPEVFRRVCEVSADALRVERAGVWLFVNGDRVLRCVCLFERSKRRHSKGACLPLADSSAYLRAVTAAPLLACESARTDPRTAELRDTYLTPNGITSLLDAPLVRDQRLVGVICHEHVGPPRDWTDADRALARSVADLVAKKMRAAEGDLRTSNRSVPTMTTIGQVSRSLGHDFRNALAEILANAELIAHIPGLPPGVADRLARISEAADRSVALLRTLLEPTPKPDEDTGEHEPLPAASSG